MAGLGLLVLALAGCGGSDAATPAVTTTVTVTADPWAAAEAGGITDGTYEVGVDGKPGKYKTAGARTDLNTATELLLRPPPNLDAGSDDNIVANNNSIGQQVIVIKKSDVAFETNGCKPWVKIG